MSPTDAYTASIDEWVQLMPALRALSPQVEQLGRAVLNCWKAGGKVLFCGNGGSAADAMHFAEELSVRFHLNRRALPAMSLLDPTVITCCGNDLGFDQIFSRQIEALGRPQDLLIVITTSGNSSNIIRAVEAAKKLGMASAALLGKTGGAVRGQCDVEIIIPSQTTARVQEAHKLLFHALCVWFDHIADTI